MYAILLCKIGSKRNEIELLVCALFAASTRIFQPAATLSHERSKRNVREDMDRLFWQEIGRYKATNRASFADCAAIALTNRVGGELVTSDHHELDAIAAGGICRIRFIR